MRMAPMETTGSDQNARVLDQFSKQAERYAALTNNAKDSSLGLLLDAVRPLPSDKMLDVGCGTGRFALTLAPLVGSIIGVDLTAAMLEQARQLQSRMSVDNVQWQQADVANLP